jgi:hypothetical protein
MILLCMINYQQNLAQSLEGYFKINSTCVVNGHCPSLIMCDIFI